MAFSNKGKTGPGPPLEQIKSGNVNFGYEYEELIPAYFALELIKNENVKSFEFEINSSRFGKFDDLIIEVTTIQVDDIVEHLALQLKHKERENRQLEAVSAFIKNKGKPFYISGYLDAFKNLEKHEKDNCKFLLFTNVEFIDLAKVKRYKINEVKPFKTNFFNTDGILQFQERVTSTSTNKDFYDKFFLVSKQKNVKELRDAIIKIFKQEFHSTVEKANSYITFFQQLRKGSYGDTKITKDAVILNLINILLSDLKISPSVIKRRNNGIDIIEQAINKFDITLLPSLDASFIEKYWKYTSTLSNEDSVTKLRQHKLLQTNEALSEEEKKQVSEQMLCFSDRKPLFIQVTEKSKGTVLSCICLIKTLGTWNISLVLVDYKFEDNELIKYKVFMNLQDLMSHEPVYKTFTEHFKISLQGRKAETIWQLKNKSGFNCDKIITPDEIFRLLEDEDTLPIGKETEPLPQFYIQRTLLRQNKLNYTNFIKMRRKCLVTVVHCDDSAGSFKRIIQTQSDLEIVDHSYDAINKNKKPKKPTIILHNQARCENDKNCCDHFKLHPEGFLEYEEIQVDPKNSKIFDNQLNGICAESGFGKTTMIKYLSQNCRSKYWVVNVPLQQMISIFKEKLETADILSKLMLLSTRDKIFVDQRASNYCLENKKIIFFFDGLDELNKSIFENSINFIKNVAEQDFKIWISCSKGLKDTMEVDLGVYCIYDIKDITVKDQEEYIRNRLENVNEKTRNNIITKILRDSTQREYEILKMPQILYILTKNLKQQNMKDLHKILSLNKMYYSFIKRKLWYKNKIKGRDSHNIILQGYENYYFQGCQVAALQTCLGENVIKLWQIHFDKTFLSFIKENNDILGIVKTNADNTFSFVHYTFAEYFAAIWLNENFKQIRIEDRQFILEPKYNGIKRFFDERRARDCPLHLAIIDQDISRVEKFAKDSNKVKERRTPLHLAVSVGARHPLLNENKTESLYSQLPVTNIDENHLKILNLLEHFDPLEKDELLELNAFQYADAAFCLSSLEELAKKKTFQWNYLNIYGQNLYTLSFYCVTMGYINLLKAAVKEKGLWHLEQLHQNLPLLNLALRSNQEDVAIFLINEGAVFNKTDSQQQTPLHEAATWGQLETAKILLQKNVDIEAKDVLGRTPLQLASKMGHLNFVKLLVEKGSDVNTTDKIERTPLQRASFRGRTEIVKYLIDNKSNVNWQSTYEQSALQEAVQMGHYETVECLIQNGADKNIVDRGKRTPLYFAAYEGHEGVAKLLINEKVNIFTTNEDGKTAKEIAKGRGHQNIVKMLEEAETLISTKFQASQSLQSHLDLHKAAEYGDLETIKQLLGSGAEIEETDHNQQTILHIAAYHGHTHIVTYLLSKNANPAALDLYRRVPLHLACHRGHFKSVRQLLTKGQNMASDKWGFTPLHRAAVKGHLEVIKLLEDSNVDLGIVSDDGGTVLHSAAKGGHHDVVKYLISKKMDVNKKDNNKETCLHYAAKLGCTLMVKFLSENYKSLLEETDNAKRTALHWAVEKGKKRMMEILLTAGADVSKRNKYKQTSLDIAKDNKLEDLILILERYSKK